MNDEDINSAITRIVTEIDVLFKKTRDADKIMKMICESPTCSKIFDRRAVIKMSSVVKEMFELFKIKPTGNGYYEKIAEAMVSGEATFSDVMFNIREKKLKKIESMATAGKEPVKEDIVKKVLDDMEKTPVKQPVPQKIIMKSIKIENPPMPTIQSAITNPPAPAPVVKPVTTPEPPSRSIAAGSPPVESMFKAFIDSMTPEIGDRATTIVEMARILNETMIPANEFPVFWKEITTFMDGNGKDVVRNAGNDPKALISSLHYIAARRCFDNSETVKIKKNNLYQALGVNQRSCFRSIDKLRASGFTLPGDKDGEE